MQTGSVTTYWKLAAFLRYAATQPEPMVARGDDDVLISPRMLVAHAQLLLTLPGGPPAREAESRWAVAAAGGEGGVGGAVRRVPYVFAGVFEWYSWRQGTLHSTGFGFSAGAARKRMRAPWRNCSADGRKPPYKGATFTIMPTPSVLLTDPPATRHRLLTTHYLSPTTCHLPPPTCFLLPAACY